jgi:hypothetical protein
LNHLVEDRLVVFLKRDPVELAAEVRTEDVLRRRDRFRLETFPRRVFMCERQRGNRDFAVLIIENERRLVRKKRPSD